MSAVSTFSTYYISVHPIGTLPPLQNNSPDLFKRQLDKAEFSHAQHLCENRQHMAGFWKQTVLPIRTNRASDLFFPALMNLVMKTKDLANNFFAIIGAMMWDLATLPIRCVTFLPRLAYNATVMPAEHPLIKFLVDKGLPPKDAEGEHAVSLFTINREESSSFSMDLRYSESYQLHLTDREVSFPICGRTSFSFDYQLQTPTGQANSQLA